MHFLYTHACVFRQCQRERGRERESFSLNLTPLFYFFFFFFFLYSLIIFSGFTLPHPLRLAFRRFHFPLLPPPTHPAPYPPPLTLPVPSTLLTFVLFLGFPYHRPPFALCKQNTQKQKKQNLIVFVKFLSVSAEYSFGLKEQKQQDGKIEHWKGNSLIAG